MLIAFLIFFPMLAAPAFYVIGRRREAWLDICAAAAAGLELLFSLLLVWNAPQFLTVPGILTGGLGFRTDGFRVAYGLIASALWFATTLFSREYFRHERENLGAYWMFIFLTLGATQGVLLSADFMTAFVFFELLSLTSFPWVVHEQTAEALRAGGTYLAIAVIGGLILFMGLLLLHAAAGTLEYAALPAALRRADGGTLLAAAVCILLGFGAKAGMFPLHVWLPLAHPVAPSPASALLSGMLTKAGVFGVLMLSLHVLYGSRAFGLLVLSLGLVTMVLGALLALFSVNLKRTLACSSMSQIGFILVGISAMVLNRAYGASEGAALAFSGTVLHMANHSFLKLVLFLAAGAVAMNLHALRLDEIRGWGRNKPLLKLAFAVGTLGIGGVPLFNGYLSKTLLHEGLVEVIGASGELAWLYRGAEALFLLSGGLTFAYMLGLYFCIFHEKNSDPERQARFDASRRCMTPLSAAALLSGTACLLLLGWPGAAARLAAVMTGQRPAHFAAFSWENLKGSLISLSAGALVYLGIVRTVLRPGRRRDSLWPDALDLEGEVYRPLLLRALPAVFGRIARLFGENALLQRAGRALVLAGTVLGRGLDSSVDALTLLVRQTALREEKVRDAQSLRRGGRLRVFERATSEALSHVLDNFSFALMMTCVGIILILVLLVLLL